jgi:hypothetical protein
LSTHNSFVRYLANQGYPVFISDWAGSVQSSFIFCPPEIKHNHTLNVVIGAGGTIAREEDMETL